MPGQEHWDRREQDLRNQLAQLATPLDVWGRQVDGLIPQVLSNAGFDSSNIKMLPKHRLKTTGSFISKALYREKSQHYTNPIADIEDKVATRLVVLTSKHISEAESILCSWPGWHARVDKNISNEVELAPTQFGYQAVHIIVRPRNTGASSEDEKLSLVACEVQVKTLFQHAYSEVSHSTVYKGPYSQDTELVRKLARSMALMEAVDEYFQDMHTRINTGHSLPAALSKDLTVRFGELWPAFNKNEVDSNLAISIFNQFYNGDVTKAELDEFVTRYRGPLLRIITRHKYYISQQPVLIYVAYLMKKHKRYLETKWYLDDGILDEIATELSISRDEYDG